MTHLDWPDLAGLGLLAYGLVAGVTRGLVGQSTRLVALFVALGLSSAGIWPVRWLAASMALPPDQYPEAVALLLIAFFLVVVLVLMALRAWFFPPPAEKPRFASRLAGALVGAVGALILYTVLLCGISWARGAERLQRQYGYEVAQVLVNALAHSPSPPRPAFLDPGRLPDPPFQPPRPGSR